MLRSPFSENFVRFCEKVFHMTHPAALQLYQDLFQKNRDILFMVVYIGLLLLMITLTISRVTRYFDEVSRAMDGLLTEDSTPIHLSSELAAVEDRINGVKVTLLQKRREALEAEQRKNDLVVYLAHDIKTPLTSVIGYLELLERLIQALKQDCHFGHLYFYRDRMLEACTRQRKYKRALEFEGEISSMVIKSGI